MEKIGRGQHCESGERKLTKNLQHNGYTQKEIAKIIKSSQKFVFTALRPPKKCVMRGRARKTTSRYDNYIEILLKRDPFMSSIAIKED